MRIRTLTGPIVLGALFATTPQLAVGQEDDEPSVEITCRACRPGTEIEGEQLGEFLAENLNVRFAASAVFGDEFYVALRAEMVSRDEGVIRKFESEAVEAEPGETYPCVKYFGDSCEPRFLAGFGAFKITGTGFGGYLFGDQMKRGFDSRECEGATHAVGITLVSDDGRAFPDYWYMCLSVEG